MSCSGRDVSDFGSSAGNSKGHFVIGSGLLPGALGGTRTPNLLIRRFQCGHPDPFRLVRGLGFVAARCSYSSGELQGRPSPWLPAWLPADDSVTPWSSAPSPAYFRQPGHGLQATEIAVAGFPCRGEWITVSW
jgi:hypothetical protein